MKLLRNLVWSRSPAIFFLLMLATVLPCGIANAASRQETNTWNEIRALSDDAVSLPVWVNVETKCEAFIKKYPESEYVPRVLAIEAQALFKQNKLDAVIAKYSPPPTNALKVADRLTYWTARSYFEKKNYAAAAENFARLGRDYPASPLRLEAIYRECEAYVKSEEWQRVIEELHEPNGAFRQLAKTNSNDQWVVSGLLLLGDAELARKDFDGARKTLSAIAVQSARPELEWERQFLVCRAQMEAGAVNEALRATTNLMAAAASKIDWRAKSTILKGEIYERLGQLAEAAQTFEANLAGDMPSNQRQQAIVRIVELTLRQEKPEEAAQKLADYLVKYPGDKGSDFEWLMLGELNLKRDYLASPNAATGQGTNLLQEAEGNFLKVTKGFTNSPYLGKAELDLGWCYLKEGKTQESLGVFSNAVEHLPFSEDQAVARFKLADTLFLQGDYNAAMTNYSDIIQRYAALPGVKNELFEQTLYQLVRACLKQTNSTTTDFAATDAISKILTWFPDGMLADRSLLLYGQSQTPKDARTVFSNLTVRYPDSSLLPEIKLAIARTFEKENDWTGALAKYESWIAAYSNNIALPRAEFWRAWANYRAGNETNALHLFTNFIAHYQSNEVALSQDLPARAQYWVGDYYWHQTDFQQAELNYEEVFQKWTNSNLALRAKMMAGCAVFQGQRPEKATNYFSSLILDPNCPPDLRAQAAFAYGDAAMQLTSTNDATKFNNAIEIFYQIATDTNYSNRPIAFRAWGRLGDCYYQMNGDASLQAATNAAIRETALQRYQRAAEYFQNAMADTADVTTRSLAAIRLGQTMAAMAALQPDQREELNERALGYFWSVLYEENLGENEQADVSCLKEAGLELAKLSGEMGYWDQTIEIYQKLEKLMPPLQGTLEKKIAYAEAQKLSRDRK